MAQHYPVFLDLRQRSCLVVGEGALAEEKIRGLLDAGAEVRQATGFTPGDLTGVALAIVCAQPADVVAAVWAEAREKGVLVNTVDDVAHCDFIAPSVMRRGDLSIAISTAGRAPVLAVRLRQKLEREIGEEHARFLALAGSVRATLAARRPDFAERRELWYRLVDSDVLDLLRQGDEEGASRRFTEILGVTPESSSPRALPWAKEARAFGPTALPKTPSAFSGPTGRDSLAQGNALGGSSGAVWLVGAGPGDPELITVRGLRCLRRADAVIYDRLVSPELLDEAPPGAEKIFVGKETGSCLWRQEEINALLISLAREGKTVVRLKGGDPFVFGRGGEEALACRAAGVPCEVVPGVTSATSVPALAGIPVTHRAVAGSFAVVTGHCMSHDRIDWEALARLDTLVVLMGLARLPELAALLSAAGRAPGTPAAVISRGTLPDERVVVGTLEDIAERAAAAGLEAPATLVIGEVVRLRERLVPDVAADACHDPATISSLLS